MRLFKTQLLLLLAALLLSLTAFSDTTPHHVSNGDRAFLLVGTIHLLHPDEYPLAAAFEQAYQSADALCLEADLALLVERNKLWLPTLEQLFNNNDTTLVLVGSLHLARPDSVLVMLEDKGYKITPYQASQD